MELMIDGKIVGELKDGDLIKRGKQVVLFRRYDGFGFSRKIIDTPEIKQIRVEYQDKTYTTTPMMFVTRGIPYSNGDDKQLILPRKWWAVKDDDQQTLL